MEVKDLRCLALKVFKFKVWVGMPMNANEWVPHRYVLNNDYGVVKVLATMAIRLRIMGCSIYSTKEDPAFGFLRRLGFEV